MTDEQAERIAKALESIAVSLEKLNNPPLMVNDVDVEVLDVALANAKPGQIILFNQG